MTTPPNASKNSNNLDQSDLSGFHQRSRLEKIALLEEILHLSPRTINSLKSDTPVEIEYLEKMSENILRSFPLPFGIATNFMINGKSVLVPMVTEEPSVIAAASNGARISRPEGFQTKSPSNQIMVGQIQLLNITNFEETHDIIINHQNELKKVCNETNPILLQIGGGYRDLRVVNKGDYKDGTIAAVIEIFIDVQDAMGANIINTMLEAAGKFLKNQLKLESNLQIISNYCIERIFEAKAVFKKEKLGDHTVVDRILKAQEFAELDVFRATTHNKGIMNGIDAVCIATGNDFRALEASVHAYAARNGTYKPLTYYSKNSNGDLVGELKIPLAIGTIGGNTQSHPISKIALNILNVEHSDQLGQIMAAVGLAQNLAALRALTSEGIQQGHMKLHNRKAT